MVNFLFFLSQGPVYAVLDYGTFVCTTCSGIQFFLLHVNAVTFFSREFNHRVKSVSMATFKAEEIEKLKRIGNAVRLIILLTVTRPECKKNMAFHLEP